ncbi:plasmid segregation oscillating ATPase ParF [Chitinophaga polysaccharea]|uniref:Plasmid segregation oscillating ATPase ParF n=1 Tax=Chitinophaga polysaccharea TaxID=1293035 RepID=A0A561P107_9BACT|nr:ParA family protein [Chitinophaga polysaccharea]TWF31760.1 plasmid segregation oscillating ATPase ParF [Chitinophaga polysaccharea]
MPRIIVIANPKGGVGKSTMAINIAQKIKKHVKTVLVDIDPQGTTTKLQNTFADLTVLNYDGKPLKDLPYDFIVVDTPPYRTEHLQELFLQADLIVIPTKAGIAELLEVTPILRLIEEARIKNPNLRAKAFFNQVISGASLTDEIKKQVIDLNMECFDTQVIHRQNYIRSVALPNGVADLKDARANEEMAQLLNEILLLIQK